MICRKIAHAVLLAMLAGGGAAQAHAHQGHAPDAAAKILPAGEIGPFPITIGGPFRLQDAHGRHIDSRHDFAGRVVMLFFGYARCPGICPTALDAMAHAMELLPPEQAARVQPVMITIDPAHDTEAVLREEFSREHPGIMGLTGSEKDIKAASDAYNINRVLVHTTDQGKPVYVHGSWIYLLDGGGGLSAILPPNASAEDIAAAIGRRL